jgi:hypothetical protein
MLTIRGSTGYDVALEFIIDTAAGTNVRAQLYVNG